jgi:hypothetical protein
MGLQAAVHLGHMPWALTKEEGLSPYRAVNTLHFGYKNQLVNDVEAKVTVCSERHTKHTNAM